MILTNERRVAMRPDKDLRIRYLALGFLIAFPFFWCSLMEVAR